MKFSKVGPQVFGWWFLVLASGHLYVLRDDRGCLGELHQTRLLPPQFTAKTLWFKDLSTLTQVQSVRTVLCSVHGGSVAEGLVIIKD